MSAYAQRWHDWVMSADDIRYGTTATHKLGDISRPNGDFFRVEGEDGDDYVGQWMTGFGFVDVRFPKSTTRPITDAERKWLAYRPVVIT